MDRKLNSNQSLGDLIMQRHETDYKKTTQNDDDDWHKIANK